MKEDIVSIIFEEGIKKYSQKNIPELQKDLGDLHQEVFKYFKGYITSEDECFGKRYLNRHYSLMSDFYSLAAVLSNLKNDQIAKESHLKLAREFEKLRDM